MFYFLKKPINKITYPVRKILKFSREIKKLRNQSKQGIFNNTKIQQKEEIFRKKYALQQLYNNSIILTYKENLYILQLLEDVFRKFNYTFNKETLNILDIGSKNFSYATALYKYFNYRNKSQKGSIFLDGIELDAYRIMADFHSRYDYAQYHIKDLANTRFLVKDFLKHEEKKYDCITWFLPFVIRKPLINWGLPMKYYQPEKMLEHAYKLLENEGIILIVNQSGIEKDKQAELLNTLGIKFTEFEAPYTNQFSPFSYDRYITVITKHSNG